MFIYFYCYVCFVLGILFHCAVNVLFVCKCVLYYCYRVNPIAVNKYIKYLATELHKEHIAHQAAICRTVSAQSVIGDRRALTHPYQTNISICYACRSVYKGEKYFVDTTFLHNFIFTVPCIITLY